MREEKVSGNIYAKKDSYLRDKEAFSIRPPSGFGWGIPTEYIEPNDLRVLADRIEASREQSKRIDEGK